MLTLNNAELAFLSVVGHPELTTKVLRVYAAKVRLFAEVFHPHLNMLWNAYCELLKKYKKEYGLNLRLDVAAAGLLEALSNDRTLPQELRTRCETILQKLSSGDIPDLEQGERLVKTLMELDANRKLVSQLNTNPGILELQQSLDATKRSMSLLDEDKQNKDRPGVLVNPFRDIRKLVTKTVRVPTGINFLDDLSFGGGREGDLWLILGRPAGGKCLGLGTPVITEDGQPVFVENIRKGDKVMGPDGKPRTVLGTTQGEDMLYSVEAVGADQFTCNGSHMITLVLVDQPKLIIDGVCRMRDVPFDIELEKYLTLPESKRFSLRMLICAPDYGTDEWPYKLGPYLSGAMVALFMGGLFPRIATASAEKVIKALRQQGFHAWGEKNPKGGEGCNLEVLDSSMDPDKSVENLRKCLPMTSTGAIRPDVFKCSRRIRLAFLEGMVEAAGWKITNSRDLFLKVGTEDQADSVIFLARSVGLRPEKDRRSGRRKSANIQHSALWWCVNLRARKSYFPGNSQKLEDSCEQRIRARFVVRRLHKMPYYGFQLDGDGRFLLGDFLVTHNSLLAVQYCCAQSMLGNNVLWATYEQSVEGDLAERMVANITDTSLDQIRDVGFDNLPQDIQDKFWAATAGVDDRLAALDMTRVMPDPTDPEDYGGVKSIRKQFDKLKAEGRTPKTVILDWFGAMMSRISANTGLDLAACYRFKAQEEINNLIQFARQEHIHVIVFHQLDAKTAATRPTYLADATHAQDMHNMQNFFDLVIILGGKDVNNIMYVSNPKSRKGGQLVRTVRMIGEKSRLVMEEGWLPNRDGNFYKPGLEDDSKNEANLASEYTREL